MNTKIQADIVPDQEAGAKTDNQAEVQFDNVQEAQQFFSTVKNRLLDVNHWHEIAAGLSATFQLTDNKGNPVRRLPKAEDHFKIDLPGPGTITGEGYDWVRVESVEEQKNVLDVDEIAAIKVRPTLNPTNDKSDVAHFFTDEATSSFIVARIGNTVTAEVHGRNEKANTKADAVIDKTRNAIIASGAKAGLSSIQWSNLVKGLLAKK